MEIRNTSLAKRSVAVFGEPEFIFRLVGNHPVFQYVCEAGYSGCGKYQRQFYPLYDALPASAEQRRQLTSQFHQNRHYKRFEVGNHRHTVTRLLPDLTCGLDARTAACRAL